MNALLPWLCGLDEGSISPGRIGPHVNDFDLLLWVRIGSMSVAVDGEDFEVTGGSALWVPKGSTESLRQASGTVVIGAIACATKRDTTLSHPRVVEVPPGWEDWLVHKHDSGFLAADGPVLRLASGRDSNAGLGARLPTLPMPRSREAQSVARVLLQAPSTPLGAEHLAARQNVSGRTLRRQFLSETGMAFSEWRTRARVVAAAGHLSEGHGVARTAKHVGYSTPAGLTRAFQRHVGLSPHDYASRAGTPTGSADETATALSGLIAAEPDGPPPIPAYRGPVRVNDCHVLL